LYRQLVPFIAFCLSLSAQAAQPARTWEFDLKTPGTYKVQVQHDVNGTVPLSTNVTYSIQTSEKTIKRDDLYFIPNQPFIPLIADITSPQKIRVVIAGLSQSALQQTSVYVFDRNTQFPEEYFDAGKSVNLKEAKRLRGILKQSEQEIDLAKTKLTIDKLIDPAIDVEANLQKIDAMVARIKAMPDFSNSSTAKMLAIKRYLYEPGEWNNHQPYQYDMDDPMGTKISHKLLTHYLTSKKGNCITMPFLFVILGQRLDIDVTASTAPLHVLVKFKDDTTGNAYNLETTSGANPARDIWYREQMPMTDQAIANGVYLRPLTRKETVAVMATVLAEYYFEQQEFEKAITISDLRLEYYPKYVEAMIMKGSAYYRLLSKYYFEKYRSPDQIPVNQRGHFEYLSQNNRLWFAKAEALGWHEPRKEDDEKYLQKVNQETQRKTAN
jgi:regulator of sirC expression with transglutaminase-like and TPR domain